MEDFSKRDSEKIIKFFNKTIEAKVEFRQSVLAAFKDIFGYHRGTFWLADERGMLIDPRYMNVSEDIMQAYAEKYFGYDPFYSFDISELDTHSNVRLLSDLVNEKEYVSENKYFREVLAPYGYVQKMVLYLRTGGRFLGGLSFLRRKDEKAFTEQDKVLVDSVSNYLSNLLTCKEECKNLRQEREEFLEFAELAGDGIIIANERGIVRFINHGARVILNRMLGTGEIGSLSDLVDKVSLDFGKIIRPNQITYKEIGGYAVNAKAKIIAGEYFYSIVLVRMPERAQLPQKDTHQPLELSLLTKREKEIVNCLLGGMNNSQMADKLFLSIQTIKTHLYNIYRKYNVTTRSALIAKVYKG